jgi:hypothetical protein
MKTDTHVPMSLIRNKTLINFSYFLGIIGGFAHVLIGFERVNSVSGSELRKVISQETLTSMILVIRRVN